MNSTDPSPRTRFPTFRRLFSVRTLRLALFCLVCLVTLVGLFYAVENWRGERAWNETRRQYAARGEKLDLAAFIPPPVPDDQNLAMTPLLAPLFDYESTPDGIRWRDTNGYPHVLMRVGLSPWRTPLKAPDFGTQWQRGTNADLRQWQQFYRDLGALAIRKGSAGRSHELSNTDGHARESEKLLTSAVPGDDLFPVPPSPGAPAADVLLALTKREAELDETKTACARPLARFPVHYQNHFAALLPHLAVVKVLTMMFSLHAVARVDLGQTDEALGDVMVCFRLQEALESEPFMISQLVRMANLMITLQPVWEGAAARRWTEPQLAAIQQRLEGTDFLRSYNRSVRAERAMINEFTETLIRRRSDPKYLQAAAGLMNLNEVASAFWPELEQLCFRVMPRGWLRRNQTLADQICQEGLVLAWDGSPPPPYQPPSTSTADRLKRAPVRPWNFLAKQMPGDAPSPDAFVRAQTYVNLAQVTCALERFHLSHHEYPERLEDLVPQFIRRIPQDFVVGQPLKYRRTPDGRFMLYSVGSDRVDNGGAFPVEVVDEPLSARGERRSHDEGDWVWRYPGR